MKNKLSLLLFLLCATISMAQSFNSQKLDSLFALLEENDKFMGTIALSHNQNTIYEKSVGFADLENGIRATNESKYRIGSISKMFTASLIFKAIENGKLDLDQTIEGFFPTIENAATITIGNLLNHSSGIHDFTRDDDYFDWNTTEQSKEKMVERISAGNAEFSPDEQSDYSNSNYVLLTFILEKIYDQPFSMILTEKIIQPLQLKNTYYGKKTEVLNNESYSYTFAGTWEKVSETNMSVPQGAGALISNATDLNTFAEQLFLGNIVSDESLEYMKTIKNGYGMGLFQFPYDDKSSYGHTGGIDGFSSITGYFPEDQLAISLTSNATNYNNNEILLAALATFFNDSFEMPSFSILELTSDDLDKYLGTYITDEIPLKISITKKGSVLFAQATGQGAFPLDPTAQNIFTFDPAGVKMEFDPEEKTLVLYQGGATFTFKAE